MSNIKTRFVLLSAILSSSFIWLYLSSYPSALMLTMFVNVNVLTMIWIRKYNFRPKIINVFNKRCASNSRFAISQISINSIISFCKFIKQIIWILHWIIQYVLQIVANIYLFWFFTLRCFAEILWNFKTAHLRLSLCWHMHDIWYTNGS